MYNASFYPTPPEVAEKMLAKVGKLYERSILEPSAGKGDLADAAVGKLECYYHTRCRELVHCIEIEPELQAAIRGKGYPLVGTDFLTFWPDEKYDLILMNPPFANGDAHLLHAWEILDHGDIVCLLNEQTLLNPCTSNRKLLATIIEEHGEVEHLGSCFAEDALRKTQVRVSMVHLRKKREEPKFSFDAGSDEEGAAVFSDGSRFESEVATRDTVGNLVAQYGRCRELFVRIAHLAQELAHYAGPLGTDGGETVGETLKELMRQKPTRRAQEDAYNRFVRSLKKSAWREVLRLTDVRNLASHGVQKEIDRILESNERMAFSEENVYALVESIFLNRGAILQQCVVEAFDIMTRYYDENRVHVEGWKTNDAWKVNRRVVLPRVVSVTFSGSGYLSYGNSRQNLNDIDRAMAFLEGKKLESVPRTAVCALEEHFKECGDDFSGVLFESTYFEMRCYKKGTLHMYFKDKGLWERFNLTAARGKNWLPDDVKAREREARARNRRADQYGLPLSA